MSRAPVHAGHRERLIHRANRRGPLRGWRRADGRRRLVSPPFAWQHRVEDDRHRFEARVLAFRRMDLKQARADLAAALASGSPGTAHRAAREILVRAGTAAFGISMRPGLGVDEIVRLAA